MSNAASDPIGWELLEELRLPFILEVGARGVPAKNVSSHQRLMLEIDPEVLQALGREVQELKDIKFRIDTSRLPSDTFEQMLFDFNEQEEEIRELEDRLSELVGKNRILVHRAQQIDPTALGALEEVTDLVKLHLQEVPVR